MSKIFVIAHTWQGISLSIEHFHSNEKAVKFVSELVSDELGVKPDPDTDLQEYINAYYEWVREENDNICDIDIAFKIIEV